MLKFIDACLNNFFSDSYFNTSHVEVYLGDMAKILRQNGDFNTSHVEVYPDRRRLKLISFSYFNTSHVEVYLALIVAAGTR